MGKVIKFDRNRDRRKKHPSLRIMTEEESNFFASQQLYDSRDYEDVPVEGYIITTTYRFRAPCASHHPNLRCPDCAGRILKRRLSPEAFIFTTSMTLLAGSLIIWYATTRL